MTQQSTSDPRTGLDKFFAALRSIGVRRRTDDKWIAGVCSGTADRLGIDPVIVRVALVLLSILGGIGITVYLVAWALLPNDKDQLAVERALRDGHGGSIVLVIFATLSLFGGSWRGNDHGWSFPGALVLVAAFVFWMVQRSRNHPDADAPVRSHQGGVPFGPAAPTAPSAAGQAPTAPFAAGQAPTAALPYGQSPTPPASFTLKTPRKPRRPAGGPLVALMAIGLALVAYGSLQWLAGEFNWTGNHAAIALSGSLAAVGALIVGLGLAGRRAGFLSFLAVVIAVAAWSSTLIPAGIHFDGSTGDARWTPTSVTSEANYRLGAGDGVLDLSGLPTEGLSEAKLPAYVGLGELTVIVPDGLTVKVVGHVGLGEIHLPGDDSVDLRSDGREGTDISRSTVVGDGPTEVVVDAGVGIGALTVVKE